MVDRLAEAVEHPAQHQRRAIDRRLGGEIFDAVAAGHTGGGIQRHQQGAIVLKADHFGNANPPAHAGDFAQRTDRQG